MDTKKRNLLIGAAAVVLILLVVFLFGMNIGKKSEISKSKELNIIEEPSETLPDFELKEYEITVDYGTQMNTNFDEYLIINNPDTTYEVEILTKEFNIMTNEEEYKYYQKTLNNWDGSFGYPGTYYIRFFNYNTEEFLTVHWNLDVTLTLSNSEELKKLFDSDEIYQDFLTHLQYLLCLYNGEYSTSYQNILFDTESLITDSNNNYEANFYLENKETNSYFEISFYPDGDTPYHGILTTLWIDDYYIRAY